jgi:hypothetical protein
MIGTDIKSLEFGIIFHLVIEKAFPAFVIKTCVD